MNKSFKYKAQTGTGILSNKFRRNILRENLTQKSLNPGFSSLLIYNITESICYRANMHTAEYSDGIYGLYSGFAMFFTGIDVD